MRNVNPRALVPTRASDGFEQELRHISREWNDGKDSAGVRAAFFLKGKIKGDFLLTAAYDSDKDTQERLFRDIQPDEFYPVYGDSAVRGYDAQSTSRLYVRIDKNRSYLLWGDFTTQASGERAPALQLQPLAHRREGALRERARERQRLRHPRHDAPGDRGAARQRHLGTVPARHPRRAREQREGRDRHPRPQPALDRALEPGADALHRLRDRAAHRPHPLPQPRWRASTAT